MSQLVLPVWIVAAVCLVLQTKAVELQNETLVTTVYERLLELYVDGQLQSLTNGDIWNLPDYTLLQPTNRLIAMELANLADPQCGGVLASVDNGSLLTNDKWKCTLFVEETWADLGYDDSRWPNAVEYGSNGDHSNCNGSQFVGNISSNAKWIWTNNLNDMVAYCRGYLPFCETKSPCLNNGTCLPNNQTFCECLSQYTGIYCETEIPTTVEATEPYTTEITTESYTGTTEIATEFTTEETSTLYTSDVETLSTTKMIDISTDYTETTGNEYTTEGTSTENMETTDPPKTTEYSSTNSIETTNPTETTAYLSTNSIETTNPTESTAYLSTNSIETTNPTETTAYLSTNSIETANPTETTKYLSTGNIKITDQTETTEYSSAGDTETTELAETTEYLSTDSTETTDPPETTVHLSTDSTETTHSPETTEYVSTDHTETTLQPETTESITNLETTWPSETSVYASTESKETTKYSEKSTESVTTEVASQTTATASTVVSDVRHTTDNVQTTATTAGQTIGSSHSTADTDQSTSQEIDFSASTWFSEADNSSNTSPVIYGDCPEELFCNGPLEKPGSSIEHCSCPSGYLNLNGNCCLNQNWIIGLTCISVGIVIGILVTVIACLLRRRDPPHDDISDRLSLSVSHGGSLLNGKAIAVTESSLITGESELPSTDNNGYMDQYYQDDKVEAEMPVSYEKMHAMPLEESPKGIPEWEPSEKEQVRQDSIFNPMMIDVLSSETGRQFRPSLGTISTDVDFSIQRPSIQLPSGPYNNFYDDNLQF